MKKIFLFICVVLFFASNAFGDTINLHLSNSTFTIQSDTVIRLHKITGDINGVPAPGSYWVDFQWDAQKLVMVPVNLGQEPVATGHTWSWLVASYSESFQYSVTSDPVNRIFFISYHQVSGSPFICHDEAYLQGNSQFVTSSVTNNNTTALITFTSAFGGCDQIYSGQTVTATISQIPAWFDFTQKFAVSFGAEPMYCEPDGSYHK